MKTNPPKVSIPTTTDAHVAAVVAERGKVYGDPFKSHRHIGMSWTALIQQHFDIELPHAIPASLVAQMMVAFKNQRSCRKHHADNLIDGRAYQGFADDFQQREEAERSARSGGCGVVTHVGSSGGAAGELPSTITTFTMEGLFDRKTNRFYRQKTKPGKWKRLAAFKPRKRKLISRQIKKAYPDGLNK